MYSSENYTDMIMINGEMHRNAAEAQRFAKRNRKIQAMGRKKKNTKTEAQSENLSLVPPSTAKNGSEQQQSEPGNMHDHKNVCNLLESPLLQQEKKCSSLEAEAEKDMPLSKQSHSVGNTILHSLQNQSGDKTQDILLKNEDNTEITEQGQSEAISVTKHNKAKQHKNKIKEREKPNECKISSSLEGERNSKSNNEREKIQGPNISNSLHEKEDDLKSEKSRKRKAKKCNIKANDTQVYEVQDSVDSILHEARTLNGDEKAKCEAVDAHKKAFNEPFEKHFNIKPESIAQIKNNSEALQDQHNPKDQESSMSNICNALSQEQIANITKTAVNLRQSLGENEKSKMCFTPELMQSLLCPAPKDTVTQEEELEYKVVQRQIFLNYACHICKTMQNDSCILKRCNNCKMISYCSKEHQREHWPVHKDLCKAISKINKAEGMTHLYQKAIDLSPNEYRHYRVHYINICANILGRELELWEKEMFFFAQVCHTCHEFQINKLKMCEKCSNVYYCQPNHLKTDHETWCNDLQIYKELIIYQFHNGMIQPHLPQIIHQKHIPLKGEMRSFLFNEYIGTDKIFQLDRLQYAALTELATCPLSALFALQQSNFPLETATSLIIHVIGAEMHFEGHVLDKWEAFMLHLLPGISMLHIVFIGPELQLDNSLSEIETKNMSCPECINNGRKITFSFWSSYYHDYVQSDQYQKPNLITAFNDGLYRNTGFHGKDSWLPSLEVMLRDPTIIVVTEYTSEELPLDIRRMEKVCPLNTIVQPTKNPFSSAKPSLNFLSDEITPVIFKNYYITVLHRK